MVVFGAGQSKHPAYVSLFESKTNILCRTKEFETCRDRGAESANMYHGIHSFKERKQPQCVFSPFFLERQRRADIKLCLVFFGSDDRNLCREYWRISKAREKDAEHPTKIYLFESETRQRRADII